MTVIRNTVTIRCTPEEAFDYLSDHRNELDWNPGVVYVEKITDGPIGRGTKFKAKWKKSPHLVMEMVEYDRPRTWAVHNGGPIEVLLTVTVTPVSAGTEVSTSFDATPHGFMTVLWPLFLRAMRREEAANTAYFKAELERRAAKPES